MKDRESEKNQKKIVGRRGGGEGYLYLIYLYNY